LPGVWHKVAHMNTTVTVTIKSFDKVVAIHELYSDRVTTPFVTVGMLKAIVRHIEGEHSPEEDKDGASVLPELQGTQTAHD